MAETLDQVLVVEPELSNPLTSIMTPPPPPYQLEVSKELGRYLVASRDIPAKEIILTETPLISGPSDTGGASSEQIPICLGCFGRMIKDPTYRCSQCYWPVCDPSCEKIPGHSQNECPLFSTNRVQYPPPHTKPILNKSILVLRCLLLKRSNPTSWAQLIQMESHLQIRQNRPNSSGSDQKIIANCQTYFGNHASGDFPPDDIQGQGQSESFTEEEIRKISGIIDVNAHILPQQLPGKITTDVCHIFPKTSLLAHSCVPNTMWSTRSLARKPETQGQGQESEGQKGQGQEGQGQDGQQGSNSSNDHDLDLLLVTRSTVPIPKGTPITVSYDSSELLFGTLRRLIPSEISGLFTCRCPRCLDPTEFGTFLSALMCPSCPSGSDGLLLPLDPTDSFSEWTCTDPTCGGRETDEGVLDLLQQIEELVDFCPGHPALGNLSGESQLTFLRKFVQAHSGVTLHPNHYILNGVYLRMIKQMGQGLRKVNATQLGEYIGLCKSLLWVADKLTPGFNENRAIVQYYLAKGLFVLMTRELQGQGQGHCDEDDVDLSQVGLGQAHQDDLQILLQIQSEALEFFRLNTEDYSKFILNLEPSLIQTKSWIDQLCLTSKNTK